MPRVNLTDAFCRSAKPIDGKLTEYADTKERGLALRITAAGVKSWTFRYRTFAGEQKRMSLGRLDDVSLADARNLVVAERAKVAKRQDPVAMRRAEKAEAVRLATLETVKEIGDRYFAEAAYGRHRPDARPKRQSTIDMEKGYFDRLIAPHFGKERLADLSRARIQAFVNDLASGDGSGEKASRSAARQCRVILNAIFNFAMWQELATVNPCRFVTVPRFRPRERILSDEELRALWCAFRDAPGMENVFVSRPVVIATQLAALTLQRRSEITGMRKCEIDYEGKIWTIPGDRTKNHRTHVVPLSDAAMTLLREAESLSKESEFVFPSPRDAAKPIEPAALSHAWRRVCGAVNLKDTRPHDLRRTGATMLTSERLGFPRFIVSRILNHASDTGGSATVTEVYDRHSYMPEKRRALEAWKELLLEIVGERQKRSANVVELRA